MKTSLLTIGIFILTALRVSAQGGSTPISGQNPAAPNNSVQSITDPQPTPQDGNATLGPTYQMTACGLNYVTASQKLGQRFSPQGTPQPANFLITGIPGCQPTPQPTILKAYVWAGASGNGVATSVTITNPLGMTTVFPMTIIGQDQDKCWGYSGTYTYRADVTSAITGNGNYVMSGFPTNPPTSGNDMDGATLMIIYGDAQASTQGTITIWDGCFVGIGTPGTQTINNMNACMAGTNARAFAAIADLQGLNTPLIFNGSAPFTIVEDWWNFIDQPTTITAGQTTAAFTVNASGDCYNLLLMGTYYQTTCQACFPIAPYTISLSSTPSTCSGNTGTATVTTSGGSAPFTYTWMPTNQNTQTATNLPPGVYTVTVTDATGCVASDTVSVMGIGSLGLTSSQTNVQCYGASTGQAIIIPTGGAGPYTYVWSPNVGSNDTISGIPAGSYTVTATDNFGCTNSFTFTITEPPLVPIIGSVTGNSPICLGASSQLTASATGGSSPYTYTWISPVSTGPTVTVTPTTTTTYSVIIADACFTPHDTVAFTVTVNPLPVITITADTLQGCAPLCVNFSATSVPTAVNVAWNFGDNTTGSGANPPVHCFGLPAVYDVEAHVTDANGCKDSLTQTGMITAFPSPVAGFDFISSNPATLLEANILIDDQSVGGDTCFWDFGDGNMLTVVGCGDVSNAYTDVGTYHVTQIVINNGGCSDTIEYDVIISPNTTIYLPNAFTPNGNGTNDFFYAYGEYIDNFHMIIFDRWGNLIFESSDQSVGWDGKANGGKLVAQSDTYVYVVTYNDHYTGRKKKIIGHVNLVR